MARVPAPPKLTPAGTRAERKYGSLALPADRANDLRNRRLGHHQVTGRIPYRAQPGRCSTDEFANWSSHGIQPKAEAPSALACILICRRAGGHAATSAHLALSAARFRVARRPR